MHKYILGIDLGTSSLKGLVVNQEGAVIESSSASYPLIVEQSGYSEQDPHEWIRAFDCVLESLIQKVPDLVSHLDGLSISGQMHSLVLLDEHGDVLRNVILWNDVRTTPQCNQIREVLKEDLLTITRNDALEGFTLPKLLWVREHEPELFKKVKKILLPKDYLRYRLTGELNMDFSDAAGTLLLDVEKKTWSLEVLDAFGLEHTLCPNLVESTEITGSLVEAYRERFGFKTEVRVIAGGADNACAAIGAGISKSGIGMCSVGTSGVFLVYENTGDKNYQGDLHFFNHADGHYYAMGVTLAAGKSLSWLKDVSAKDESFDSFLEGIDTIPVGSDGLLFTPYITGERTPYADSKIRGSFIGLDISHTRLHMARAVLEGVTFSLMDSKRIIDKHSKHKLDAIVSVGGGAKNRAQLQIQANIFNTPIVTLEYEEGPALGAAMIAAVGLGWFETFADCSSVFVKYRDRIEPIEKDVVRYQKIYNIYRQVYAQTASLCHQLSEI